MTTIESKLKELENLNRYPTKHGDSVISKDIQQLIQALREAVAALNYVADYENIGRAVYSDTDPERARQSLTNIEKILNGEQK